MKTFYSFAIHLNSLPVGNSCKLTASFNVWYSVLSTFFDHRPLATGPSGSTGIFTFITKAFTGYRK